MTPSLKGQLRPEGQGELVRQKQKAWAGALQAERGERTEWQEVPGLGLAGQSLLRTPDSSQEPWEAMAGFTLRNNAIRFESLKSLCNVDEKWI